MSLSRKRILAVTIGLALGACPLLWQRDQGPEPAALASVVSGGDLRIANRSGGTCARDQDGLRVTSSAGEWVGTLAREDQGIQSRTTFAEFSFGWAERRSLWIVLGEAGPELAQALFDTDYGTYAGVVLGDQSSTHAHEDVLCFDLAVERRDGSGRTERWLGRVKRP